MTAQSYARRTYPKARGFAELEFELDGNGSDYRVMAVKHESERLRLSAEALLTLTDVLHALDAYLAQGFAKPEAA